MSQFTEFHGPSALIRTRFASFRFILRCSILIAISVVCLDTAVLFSLSLGYETVALSSARETGSHPLTLITILALAGALVLRRPLRKSKVSDAFLGLAAALCTLRLFEILVAGDNGLVSEPAEAILSDLHLVGTIQMGWNTACALLLLSAGILIARNHFSTGLLMIFGAATFAFASIAGWVFGPWSFHGAMSPFTAVVTGLLSVSALAQFMHKNPLRMMFFDTTVARLLRRQGLTSLIACLLGAVAIGMILRFQLDPLFPLLFVALTCGLIAINLRLGQDLARQETSRNVDAKRAATRLLDISLHDGLTGALRRESFSDFAGDVEKPHARGVILIALDDFHEIKDAYGPEIRDKLLAEAGEAIESRLVRGDQFFRWGSEEFLVLVNDVGRDRLPMLAESMLSAVKSVHLPDQRYLPASVGSHWLAPYDVNFNAAISNADVNLYRSKFQDALSVQTMRPAKTLQT